MKANIRKILYAMLLGVVVYFGFALYSGFGKIRDSLAIFHFETFVFACGLAFGNYVLRFLKWEFYLARLDIRGVPKLDSFLTFLSGFVLTVTPGKVGEVFKSLVLFETPIRNHLRPGDALYDPFLGSGTALIAAERSGTRCYALEIDPLYVEVALRRWEPFSGQAAERLDG